jgi:hypothetical protein
MFWGYSEFKNDYFSFPSFSLGTVSVLDVDDRRNDYDRGKPEFRQDNTGNIYPHG